ncbi:hypothetical protein DFA_02101 [Cavenderia fasciculata]|uniref:EGF-like domain-containing protein n=1 Tax=Cavenderia fasciculata TaxID=261658 RepID=F4PYP8_CACFS|nr:uncharacterized protein DFA_02101 [Cavenderia fasciculata]EGG19314.1 hypothetical protein DFA_02101 [Cavenderia fasciculata]|eukprot:XP_004357585.1 hypothetical protein DFA_02101 [Cavenderia fasciculata]
MVLHDRSSTRRSSRSSTSSSTSVILVLVSLLLLFVSTCGIIATPDLPEDEFKSAEWLIKYFGSYISTESSIRICTDDTYQIDCILDDNDPDVFHIIKFPFMTVVDFEYVGELPNITKLTFPYVTEMDIQILYFDLMPPEFAEIDLLSYFTDLPSLESLIITDDRLHNIPDSFSNGNFPSLTKLGIYSTNILSVETFINITTVQDITISKTTSPFTIDPTIYLPNLINFNLLFSLNDSMDISFSQHGFPNLDLIYITYANDIGHQLTITVETSSVTQFIGYREYSIGYATINPQFIHPESLIILDHHGGASRLSPQNMSLYSNLQSLTLEGQLFPPINTPFPASLKSFKSQSEWEGGKIPSNLLDNDPNNLVLDFNGNHGITGDLSQAFCYIQGLRAPYAPINSIPSCWWCYNSSRLSTIVQRPASPLCNIQIDSFNLTSYQGWFNITGDNIGWGDNTNFTQIYPNKKLMGKIDLSLGRNQVNNYSLVKDPIQGYTFEFTISEVSFQVNNVIVDPLDSTFNATSVTVVFDFVNPIVQHQPSISYGGYPCQFQRYQEFTKSIVCTPITYPNNTKPLVKIENQFNQTITNPDVVLKSVNVVSYTLDPPSYPPTYLNLIGYFGINTNLAVITLTPQDETLQTYGCEIIQSNQTFIQCKLQQLEPPPGITGFDIVIPSYGSYNNISLIVIPAPIQIIVTQYQLEPPIYPPTLLNLFGYFGTILEPKANVSIQSPGHDDVECLVKLFSSDYIQCSFTHQPFPGPSTLVVTVPHGSYNSPLLFIPYPSTNVESYTLRPSTYPPTHLELNGYFGPDTNVGQVLLADDVGGDQHNIIQCTVTDINETSIICQFENQPYSGPLDYTVVVPNGNYSSQLIIPYIQSDVLITSVKLIDSTRQIDQQMILNGHFGLNVSLSTIRFNNTDSFCSVTTSNETTIECHFTKQPSSGSITPLTLVTPNGDYSSNTILFIPYPSLPSDDEECMVRTNNCSGHGKCVDGKCQCVALDWYDDCKFKISSNQDLKSIVNLNNPTISFGIGDDYRFEFSMIAIQELDINNQTIKELHTTNNWNNYTDTTSTTTNQQYKSLEYQLSLSTNINNIIFENTNIKSTIEISNNGNRTIQFGDESIYIGNNSIKSTVSIKDWPYSTVSESPHLVVLFSTTINNNQTIIGCDGSINQVETFQSFQDSDSIEFIRIITNDDIQFFGQFLPFVISDNNKSTYSKIELINTTRINDQQSIVLIGIHLPQCQLCLIDPQFTPLQIDREIFGECPPPPPTDNRFASWKIAVILVCTIIPSIAVALFVFIKYRQSKKATSHHRVHLMKIK